jgi:hypothetical protein
MMLAPRRWHSKPLFWFVVIILAALFAYSGIQQITFVPNIPFRAELLLQRGYAQIFATLFVGFAFAILAGWFLVVLLSQRLRFK